MRLTEGLGRPSSWLSQILSEGEHSRGVFLDHIDAISGHFHVAPGELFRDPNSHIDNAVQLDKMSPSDSQEREKAEGASMNDDPGPRRDHKHQEVLAIYEYARSRTNSDSTTLAEIVNEFDALVRRRVDDYQRIKERRGTAEAAKK